MTAKIQVGFMMLRKKGTFSSLTREAPGAETAISVPSISRSAAREVYGPSLPRIIQAAHHSTPTTARTTNAVRHPCWAMTQASTGAKATMPSVTPEEATAAGVAPFFEGNHL